MLVECIANCFITVGYITSPQKIELSDLTAEELKRCKPRNKILNPRLTKKK